MAEFGAYLAKWLFYYFMFGMALHVLDRYVGVPFYRWWYNRSREAPMPVSAEVGLLYRRPFNWRHNTALIISAIQSGYTVWTGGSIDPFVEIIVLVFEAETLLVGFWAGRWAYEVIKRQKQIAEAVDHMGTTVEQTDVSGLLRRVPQLLKAALSGIFSRVTPEAPVPQQTPPVAQKPEAAQEPAEPHWRDRLNQYTKKG